MRSPVTPIPTATRPATSAEKPDVAQTISDRPPDQTTLNFARLFKDGLLQVQTLSHDVWSDFNEHDPGVTMLEALCYGLTDLAYRTDHPIEDILASSMAITGVPLDDQPLFTGNRILTNAALTQTDYRKLAYDDVRGLRNLWLRAVPQGASGKTSETGLLGVFVQSYHPPPASNRSSIALAGRTPTGPSQPDGDPFLRTVQRLLQANRNLGQDFAHVRRIATRENYLSVSLSIGSDDAVETVIADMLYRVQMRLDPAPVLRDVGPDLAAGVSPAHIFQGPALSHGWITDASLAPLNPVVPYDSILDAMTTTPGILDIGTLKIDSDDDAGAKPDPAKPILNVLSRRPHDLRRIRVLRDGVPQKLDIALLLSKWHHREEQARWHAGYATRKVKDLDYARVPLGNPNRHLGRYRSIQHLFPGVYGLAAQGEALNAVSRYRRDQGAQAAQGGARNQLKGYLLFFEQLLADYLAQLDHASLLLSFRDQDRTYYTQPLLHPDRPDPDAPPEIAPILGQGTIPDNHGSRTWFDHYDHGIHRLSRAHDPVEQRLNRTLDAFLARFNADFTDKRLQRVCAERLQPDQSFDAWLAGQKRAFLRQIVPLTARRGLGVDLAMPEETALQKATRLRTGHQGMIAVIEHILLRDRSACVAIPHLRIDNHKVAHRFLVHPTQPVHAVRLGRGDFHVTLVLDPGLRHTPWSQIIDRIVALAATPDAYQIGPRGGYTLRMRLHDPGDTYADVLHGFASYHLAKIAQRNMIHLCRQVADGHLCPNEVLTPAQVPGDFFHNRISIFLTNTGNDPKRPEYRRLVQDSIAAQMPAHLQHHCYWLTPCDISHFATKRADWMAALAPLAMSPDPSERAKIAATQASRHLRTLVERYFTAAILRERTVARRVAVLQAAGRI